jgi:uncharacterized protein (DUF697 family)
MNAFESTHDEFQAGEYESGDHFEFESDHESFGESGLESPLNEAEEMELATELLGVSSEAELDQFVGKLFKKAWGGIKKVAASPLGGMIKGLAKKALPFVGSALGSFIPIPGVGTMVGRAIGTAASNLLEFEAEGSPEDQEFELARRFVRLASTAATECADVPPGRNPQAAAAEALQKAAGQLGSPQPRPSPRGPGGRWYRRGNKIVLLGA